MKKVAVIGASGNMGRRYALILEKYCDCEVVRVDLNNTITADVSECDGFIIATPTSNHIADILTYSQWKKPILCEKPVTKSMLKLRGILADKDLDLSMINQYDFLDVKNYEGHTEYNYFKTGSDGLLWDCINIIGTARSSYCVLNERLVWECQLNGKKLDLRDMDHAYVHNITEWVDGWRNKDYILPAHEKVWRKIGHDNEG
jgi:hypothetical protein